MTLQITLLGVFALVTPVLVLAMVSVALAARLARAGHEESRSAPPATPSFDANDQLGQLDQLRAQVQTLQRSQKALHAELAHCRNAIARIERDGRQALPQGTAIESLGPSALAASRRTPPDIPPPPNTPLANGIESRQETKLPPVCAITSPAAERRGPPLPLPRPEPQVQAVEAKPELSDEEIDALPPEVPTPGKPRKRILPPPKKPAMRSL